MWLRVSHEFIVKMSVGTAVICGLKEQGQSNIRMAHLGGYRQEASVLCPMDHSIGLLVFKLQKLVSSRESDPRGKEAEATCLL